MFYVIEFKDIALKSITKSNCVTKYTFLLRQRECVVIDDVYVQAKDEFYGDRILLNF